MRSTTSSSGIFSRNIAPRKWIFQQRLLPMKCGSLLLFVGAGGSNPLSFSHGDGLTCGDIGEPIYQAAGPANFNGVGLFALSETKGQNKLAGGKITGAAAEHLCLCFPAESNTHRRSQAIAVGFRANQLDAQALV